MKENNNDDTVKCSFCGRDGSEVASMVAGPDVYICDNCIQSSVSILKEKVPSEILDTEMPIMTPNPTSRKMR